MKNRKKYFTILLYENKCVIRLMTGRINAVYAY